MITYKKRKKYKYSLSSEYEHQTDITSHEDNDGPFLSLSRGGLVTIKKGYCWDGPSGPAIDTKSFMRASLVHDALYQLMREGVIEATKAHRKKADKLMRDICIEAGMLPLFAHIAYAMVRIFAGTFARPHQNEAP